MPSATYVKLNIQDLLRVWIHFYVLWTGHFYMLLSLFKIYFTHSENNYYKFIQACTKWWLLAKLFLYLFKAQYCTIRDNAVKFLMIISSLKHSLQTKLNSLIFLRYPWGIQYNKFLHEFSIAFKSCDWLGRWRNSKFFWVKKLI